MLNITWVHLSFNWAECSNSLIPIILCFKSIQVYFELDVTESDEDWEAELFRFDILRPSPPVWPLPVDLQTGCEQVGIIITLTVIRHCFLSQPYPPYITMSYFRCNDLKQNKREFFWNFQFIIVLFLNCWLFLIHYFSWYIRSRPSSSHFLMCDIPVSSTSSLFQSWQPFLSPFVIVLFIQAVCD